MTAWTAKGSSRLAARPAVPASTSLVQSPAAGYASFLHGRGPGHRLGGLWGTTSRRALFQRIRDEIEARRQHGDVGAAQFPTCTGPWATMAATDKGVQGHRDRDRAIGGPGRDRVLRACPRASLR